MGRRRERKKMDNDVGPVRKALEGRFAVTRVYYVITADEINDRAMISRRN